METNLGKIPCSVVRFVQFFLLREDRKARFGFESMLSIEEVKLRKSLLRCIIECYDPIEDESLGQVRASRSPLMMLTS
jgi:hypothetical protein